MLLLSKHRLPMVSFDKEFCSHCLHAAIRAERTSRLSLIFEVDPIRESFQFDRLACCYFLDRTTFLRSCPYLTTRSSLYILPSIS
jgi:hypothetical protein